MDIAKTGNLDIVTIIVGSLALIMTYSWNNLIKEYIDHYYPIEDDSLTVKTYYTLSLTLMISIVMFYLVKYKDKIQSPINMMMTKVLI